MFILNVITVRYLLHSSLYEGYVYLNPFFKQYTNHDRLTKRASYEINGHESNKQGSDIASVIAVEGTMDKGDKDQVAKKILYR